MVKVTQAEKFVSRKWSHRYQTNSTKDIAASIFVDEENGVAFLVGRVKGPRGTNVSFSGLLEKPTGANTLFDDSKTFEDAVIAKVSIEDGSIFWARRLLTPRNSKFSAVTLSRDKQTVFAAGTIFKDSSSQPFIVQAYNTETGAEKGPHFESSATGHHFVRSIIADEESLHVCGRTSTKSGDPLVTASPVMGGIMIAAVSLRHEEVWFKQGGTNLQSDYCSALSLSPDRNLLFLAATSRFKSSTDSIMLDIATVYAISPTTGSLVWLKKLQSSPGIDLRSSDIVSDGDAVYVSTSKWTISSGRKAVIHKLSSARGTVLWSRETCCSSKMGVVNNKRIDGEPVIGLAKGNDGYIYHIAHYKQHEKLTKDKHATVIVRVGCYGEYEADMDVSTPVSTFMLQPGMPRWAEIGKGGRMVYVLSNEISVDDAGRDRSVPQLGMVRVSGSKRKVIERPRYGAVYLKIGLQVLMQSVSKGAVFDLLAERLRMKHSDMQMMEAEDTSSGADKVKFTVRVFGEDLEELYSGISAEVEDLFKGTGHSGKNTFERHFSLSKDKVHLVKGSITRLERGRGTAAPGGSSATGSNPGSGAVKNGGGSNWMLIGIGIAGVAGVSLLAGTVFWFWRRRQDDEESFAQSGIDGRPSDAGAEVAYYSADVQSY